MHKLTMYENLRDMLEKEVTEIEKKGSIDVQSLDNLYKLMTALKATDKILEREQGGGMSNNSYGYAYGRTSYDRSNDGMSNRMPWPYPRAYDGGSYDEGMSNARRGRDGDGDGRYNESRDNFRDSSNRGHGSYDNSYRYSRDTAKKKMVEKLTTLLDDTMSEQDRNAIMDCIDKIQ